MQIYESLLLKMNKRLEHIAIIGGGSAGWMSAAALANAVGSGCKITLVESESIAPVGVGEATIPPIRHFNARLGIDEATFIRETKGSFKLGIEFADWRVKGESYFHPFGNYGAEFDSVPFYQYWIREHLAGNVKSLDEFTLAWIAAREGRYEPPMRDPRNIRSRHDYAYHFDAGLYAQFLRRYSEARGVTRIEGRVSGANFRPTDGHIESVKLDDGQEISADLFIDCTGFYGLLTEKYLETGYEAWSHWLPCNRAVAAPCHRDETPIKPYTISTAKTAGWQWRIPLQHRIGNGYVYCDQFLSPEEAEAELIESLEAEPAAPPKHLKFTTGMRKKFWHKNCVAIGLSAGFMEPLESTSLHLIQYGVMRLVAMLPDRDMSPLLAEEYNKLTRAEYERIRDFLVLHYHATERDDTPFWRHCQQIEIPDSLAYKIAQFRENGMIVSDERELFHNPSWIAVYIGQGIVPKRAPTGSTLRDDVPVAQRLDQIHAAIREGAAAMPEHEDYIQQLIN